jgi:hypothetical protein
MPVPPVLAAKWTAALLDEGFVAFPKRLIRVAPRVFRGEHAIEQLAVVLAIVDYLRPHLARFPSLGYLAFVAGIEPERFQERLNELAVAGLVTSAGNREAMRFDLDGLYQVIRDLSDAA